MYELYGVMLHSGGAYGGHYSAYIKDTEGFGIPNIKVIVGSESNFTTSEDDGYFVFDNVNTGEWKLSAILDSVQGNRYINTDSIYINIDDSKPTRQDVILNLGNL